MYTHQNVISEPTHLWFQVAFFVHCDDKIKNFILRIVELSNNFLLFFIQDPGPLVDEYPEVSGITTARDAMKKMPEQDRAKIAEQVEVFRVEKRKFDIEVSKWDDNGNDIIVLAKHMVRLYYIPTYLE